MNEKHLLRRVEMWLAPRVARKAEIAVRLGAACLVATCLFAVAKAQTAPKTAAPKPLKTMPAQAAKPLLLTHYMPWFVAKPRSDLWGWHWTMNAFDPDTKEQGKRRLASQYTPLIGPYDSSDPNVIEYHFGLMKLAGIDGLIVDWYGLADEFDYPMLKRNSDLLLRAANRCGLKIAICYEDQTVANLQKAGKLAPEDRVKHVADEIDWLQKNWFSNSAYLKRDGRPVLLSFGESGLTNAEWQQVFTAPRDQVLYLSEHRKRDGAQGAFDWPTPGSADAGLDRFYKDSQNWPVVMPTAYPRFNDIYGEAKVSASYPPIPDDAGRRYESTLRRAIESRAPWVQLVTWNDWGEGTQIEPSREFGFRDLETTQRLRRELVDAKFAFKADDLRLPLRVFELRQKEARSPRTKAQLDRISQLVVAGSLPAARLALHQAEIALPK